MCIEENPVIPTMRCRWFENPHWLKASSIWHRTGKDSLDSTVIAHGIFMKTWDNLPRLRFVHVSLLLIWLILSTFGLFVVTTWADGAGQDSGSGITPQQVQTVQEADGSPVCNAPIFEVSNATLTDNSATGKCTVTTGGGLTSADIDTSAELAAIVTDETGSGLLAFATAPTLTSPKIGTGIYDTNNNELFLLTATGSAVNELTYNNAATGNNPTFTSSGGDTNIGVAFTAKGTGGVVVTSTNAGPSLITKGATVNNGSGNAATDNFTAKGGTDATLLIVDAVADKVYVGESSDTAGKFAVKVADNGTAIEATINATQANCTTADLFAAFYSTSGLEGSIACTGVAGVVAYNTFLSSHYTTIRGERPVVGMVLELTGRSGVGIAPYLAESRLCRTPASTTVYGVYGGATKEGIDTVLGGGSGFVLVSNATGNIAAGDLLECDGHGYARKQSDSVIRSSTLGKANVDIDWSHESMTTKLIGVLLYSG